MTTTPVALVTGSSRGIGHACAQALVRHGYRVAMTGRTQKRLDEAASRLRANGAELRAYCGDLSSADDIQRIVEAVARDLGRLDVLVINSGGPPKGAFDELDDDAWAQGIDEVLMGAVRSVRFALPQLQASGRGRIVVIGSSSVRRPLPGLTLSNTLRPALAGLVSTLAVELAPIGVTVNMVAPGRTDTERLVATDTDMARRQGRTLEEFRSEANAELPLGRLAQPYEIAATVTFLASEDAGYLTGQTILVDGGLALGRPWTV